MKRFHLVAALAAGLLVLLVGGAAGPASAAPVSVSQQYSCKFPIVGNDAVKVTLRSDLPLTMKVGESVYASDIKLTLDLSRRLAQGLTLPGGATIEGRATLGIRITQPGGPDVNTGLTAGFPSRDLPSPAADFSMTDLTSIAPDKLVTWDRPGPAQFHALALRLHNVTVRDTTGQPLAGLTDFTTACTLTPGQPTLFTTVDVLANDGDAGSIPAQRKEFMTELRGANSGVVLLHA